MFEHIGRPLDPAWPVRQAVAVWLLVVAAQCAGAVTAAVAVVLWLARALWHLVQWLFALWFAITVPDLDVLLELPDFTLAPEELDVVEVALDGGWEELDDDWAARTGLEALPDRPLPSLEPVDAPEVPDPLHADEFVASSVLLKLLGTSAESGSVVEDLFADEGPPEDAFAPAEMVEAIEIAGVLGALSSDDISGVFASSSGLSNDLTGIGGLIGAAGTEIGSGALGSHGEGLGGGGSAMGLGGLGTRGEGVGGGTGFGGLGTIGSQTTPPRKIHLAEVAWPDEPLDCSARVEVDVDGTGSIVRFLVCPEAVRPAIEAAVAASRFRPAEREGEPVVGTMHVTWR